MLLYVTAAANNSNDSVIQYLDNIHTEFRKSGEEKKVFSSKDSCILFYSGSEIPDSGHIYTFDENNRRKLEKQLSFSLKDSTIEVKETQTPWDPASDTSSQIFITEYLQPFKPFNSLHDDEGLVSKYWVNKKKISETREYDEYKNQIKRVVDYYSKSSSEKIIKYKRCKMIKSYTKNYGDTAFYEYDKNDSLKLQYFIAENIKIQKRYHYFKRNKSGLLTAIVRSRLNNMGLTTFDYDQQGNILMKREYDFNHDSKKKYLKKKISYKYNSAGSLESYVISFF